MPQKTNLIQNNENQFYEIKKQQTDKKRQRQQKQQVQLCSICFTRKMTARIDCCDHQFCNTCIKDWVKGDTKTCPLCRRDVNVINSIRTGKVLFRVKRQVEQAPVIVVVDEDAAEEAEDAADEADWIEEQRQQEQRRARRRQRQRRQQEEEELLQRRERQQRHRIRGQRSEFNEAEHVMEPRENVEQQKFNLWILIFICLGVYFLYGIFSK